MPTQESTISVEYREVVGKPGYRVGDDGSTWSCLIGRCRPRIGTTWKQLKPQSVNQYGHLYIRINRKAFAIHRLILEAFRGPCPKGMECRHLDGDPTNNRLDNLEWGTHLENVRDSMRHGRFALGSLKAENHPQPKLTNDQVREIRSIYANGNMTQREIGIMFNIHQVTVGEVVRKVKYKSVE